MATIPGLPLLVLEFIWMGEGATNLPASPVYWAAVGLLALAWLLPRSRAYRVPRAIAAGVALCGALSPFVFIAILDLAMN
ncbi:hypothetical protein JIX56_23225 [Streptomyces sp. CA-210063]|uniref:hypothetical protein n=1 Tax=Streptomyces sp. CA-210063 TaxID=2801029 RepID=UPI00214C50DA|nr:hypothetical protein [Streptomyces sp. CA-210063]UUU32575.1 hypothetical protein JIX56_23225 [Streptomyces sp. CA-210063]